jgi:hypothetical protein
MHARYLAIESVMDMAGRSVLRGIGEVFPDEDYMDVFAASGRPPAPATRMAAIRRVAREMPGAAEVIAAECTGFDYARERRPVIGWSDPKAA